MSRRRDFSQEHPAACVFAGVWSGVSPAPAPRSGQEDDLLPTDWDPSLDGQTVLLFLPDGGVTGSQVPFLDQGYTLVVSAGVEYSSLSQDGFATLQGACRPYTVSVARSGSVVVKPGLVGGSSLVQDQPLSGPSDPILPPISRPGHQEPVIAEVASLPKPLPETLPPGVDATLGPSEILTLRVYATDPDLGAELHCRFDARRLRGSGGPGSFSFNHDGRFRFDRTSQQWVSDWQWRPEPGSATGDQFELRATVTDDQGLQNTTSGSFLITAQVIDEQLIAYNSGGDLYTVHVDGTNVTRIIAGPSNESYPTLSPDGTRLVFISDRNGNQDIFTANVDGSGVRALTNTSGDELKPGVSPDGSQFVYGYRDSGQHEIRLIDADGGNSRLVVRRPRPVNNPSISPNGDWILFSQWPTVPRVGDPSEIYLVKNDGSGLTLIGYGLSPRFHPDVRNPRVIFEDTQGAARQIHRMDITLPPTGLGTNITTLISVGDNHNPLYSPDGARLIYEASIGGIPRGPRELWLSEADGSNAFQLTTNQGSEPSWSR